MELQASKTAFELNHKLENLTDNHRRTAATYNKLSTRRQRVYNHLSESLVEVLNDELLELEKNKRLTLSCIISSSLVMISVSQKG